MLSDDYLMRRISQAAAVFARIIGLKKSGDYQDALEEIHQNLEQWLGVDKGLLRLLDDESLFRNLSGPEPAPFEQLACLADLFSEEGEICRLQGNLQESDTAYARSLALWLMADSRQVAQQSAEIGRKIRCILSRLPLERVPSKTLFELFCYHENAKDYPKAEAVLKALSDRLQDRADAEREMSMFYKRLLEKDPKGISANGWSRSDVQKKMRGLRGRRRNRG